MYATIDTETLKERLDSNQDLHLIEVLAEKEFKRLHIRGAEHIQFGRIAGEANKRFGKEDEIIVYCADRQCTASTIAAKKLDSMGFTNVYDFEGGKQAWQDAGYPMEGEEALV